MKLTGNTVLITGGSAGLGLTLAREFLMRGNVVIITGRDAAKLAAAKVQLPALHTRQGDVTDPVSVEALYTALTHEFPALNVLINNAGVMRKINLQQPVARLTAEIDVNLTGTLRMALTFLPHLKRQPEATIINVSSGLAFVPLPITPVYSATKAAIHSFTQSLRIQLRDTDVSVVELAPGPVSDTELAQGEFSADEIAENRGQSLDAFARETMRGLAKGKPEIKTGLAKALYFMSRILPRFNVLGRTVEPMLAKERALLR